MEEIYCLNFNQDQSYITLGTSVGFKVLRIHPTELIHQKLYEGGFHIAEMLGSSQVMVLVGRTDTLSFSSKGLTLWNSSDKVPI